MYLLIASTSHDLRADSFSFVDGPCVRYRVTGIGILTVFVVVISSALSVLVATLSYSVSIMLNVVAVLFVADLVSAATHPPTTRGPPSHEFFLFTSTSSILIRPLSMPSVLPPDH